MNSTQVDQESTGFIAWCACGWEGTHHGFGEDADAEADAHKCQEENDGVDACPAAGT